MEHKLGAISVFLLVLVGYTVANGDIRCLECYDLPNPFDCNTVTTCSSIDKCYVKQFVDSAGHILYDMGCMSDVMCNTRKRSNLALSLRRAREVDRDVTTCEECCEGDYCNLQGCGSTALQRPNRGPICFSCDAQDHLDNCRSTAKCDIGEVCMVRQSHQFMPFYSSECVKEKQCDVVQVTGTNECVHCCDDDFCNERCNMTQHG